MPALIPGLAVDLVATVATDAAIPVSEPHLILAANEKLDILIAIPTTARHKQGRHYFLGPKKLSYAKIERLLDPAAPAMVIRPFVARAETNLTDEELDKKYKRKGQAESVALQQLKLRWAMLEPLVCGTDAELLLDPEHRGVASSKSSRDPG